MTNGQTLSRFFYDLFALAESGQGFVNATTLKMMMDFKKLEDDWCEGPNGGYCQYGLGLMRDQVGQDVFNLADRRADPEEVRLDGHPGEDWGSGCSPCGYNAKYSFGMCIAYTSLYGMNCSNSPISNARAIEEATCRIYDAVLKEVGGPRLKCPRNPSPPPFAPDPKRILHCEWVNNTPEVKPWVPPEVRLHPHRQHTPWASRRSHKPWVEVLSAMEEERGRLAKSWEAFVV